MNVENYQNKTIDITLKNKQIKLIKSALAAYQGDPDLLEETQNLVETKAVIHEAWKILNPS